MHRNNNNATFTEESPFPWDIYRKSPFNEKRAYFLDEMDLKKIKLLSLSQGQVSWEVFDRENQEQMRACLFLD